MVYRHFISHLCLVVICYCLKNVLEIHCHSLYPFQAGPILYLLVSCIYLQYTVSLSLHRLITQGSYHLNRTQLRSNLWLKSDQQVTRHLPGTVHTLDWTLSMSCSRPVESIQVSSWKYSSASAHGQLSLQVHNGWAGLMRREVEPTPSRGSELCWPYCCVSRYLVLAVRLRSGLLMQLQAGYRPLSLWTLRPRPLRLGLHGVSLKPASKLPI